MTIIEELKSYWPHIALHGGRILAGFLALILITLGGWVSAAVVSYLLGMILIKKN